MVKQNSQSGILKLTNHIAGKCQNDQKAIVWQIVRFQNGSNKVAIELRVVQFWSEIILVISNHAYDFRPNCTPLSSISIYHYYMALSHKDWELPDS